MRRKDIDPTRRRDRPLSVWKEEDSIDGEKVKALVMIIDGPGCSWSKKLGCSMCGYCNDVAEGEVSDDDLFAQAKKAMERYDGEPYIKIFTSGSFLDPDEIPLDVQKRIVVMIGEMTEDVRLLVESRPEFVSDVIISSLGKHVGDMEIAIGLETSNDGIRSRYIQKGFTWDHFVDAGRIIERKGALLKTYLLQKPPLLGEKEAMDDMISSIEDIHREFPGSRISVNPMNIQSFTIVEKLNKRGSYRPPWLWSLVSVLREGYGICEGETHLMSSPTGGGKRRGSHNCGRCDQDILDRIAEFSILNDPDKLPEPMGCCFPEWEAVIKTNFLSEIPFCD